MNVAYKVVNNEDFLNLVNYKQFLFVGLLFRLLQIQPTCIMRKTKLFDKPLTKDAKLNGKSD